MIRIATCDVLVAQCGYAQQPCKFWPYVVSLFYVEEVGFPVATGYDMVVPYIHLFCCERGTSLKELLVLEIRRLVVHLRTRSQRQLQDEWRGAGGERVLQDLSPAVHDPIHAVE